MVQFASKPRGRIPGSGLTDLAVKMRLEDIETETRKLCSSEMGEVPFMKALSKVSKDEDG